MIKDINGLKDIVFYNTNYDTFDIPKNSIIYCDPPYQGTTKYKTDVFDYNKFWNWCRSMSTNGHKIFISEYNAPSDFTCIWQKEVANTLVKNTGEKKGIEKLFIYNANS